jgi:hypothetical protein
MKRHRELRTTSVWGASSASQATGGIDSRAIRRQEPASWTERITLERT